MSMTNDQQDLAPRQPRCNDQRFGGHQLRWFVGCTGSAAGSFTRGGVSFALASWPGLRRSDWHRLNLKSGKVVLARKLYADKSNSISEICKNLNISRATLYRYVK
jgi:hypothetical protein